MRRAERPGRTDERDARAEQQLRECWPPARPGTGSAGAGGSRQANDAVPAVAGNAVFFVTVVDIYDGIHTRRVESKSDLEVRPPAPRMARIGETTRTLLNEIEQPGRDGSGVRDA